LDENFCPACFERFAFFCPLELFLGTHHHRMLSPPSKQENACPGLQSAESSTMRLLNNYLPSSRKASTGFTLIELLVVIAIIAILMALLFPAAGNALNSAKKTTAKNQAVQVVTAITAYETEYGRLPNFTGSNISSANIAMLSSTNDSANNPRAVIFMEATAYKPGKGGTNSTGFCDPWGNVYSVALDTNYANTLQNMPYQTTVGGAVTLGTNLTKHVGVWTVFTNSGKNYLINSWD
jgi:prepilin-type N-terminal cleavage/methylation domain-containing protein